MTGFGLARRWRHGWRKVQRVSCPECGRALPLTRPVRDAHLLKAHGWKRTTWHIHAVHPVAAQAALPI